MSLATENANQYLSLLHNFAHEFKESFLISNKNPQSLLNQIMVAGMGGSGISGDYFKSVVEYYTDKIVMVSKDYHPPKFVSKTWSTVVISYSGNTEETINTTKTLLSRGLIPIIITSGGKLKEIATENQLPLFLVPSGLQPRAAFPILFGTLLGLSFNSLNLPINIDLLFKEFKTRNKNLLDTEFVDSLSKLAEKIIDKPTWILSSHHLSSVGYRFKCQLNENAKLHVTNFYSPEFSHNGIVGFDGNLNEKITLLLIESNFDYDRTVEHLQFLSTLHQTEHFQVKSDEYLLELLTLTLYLDYVSVTAAKLQNIDPYAIISINKLKKKLSTLKSK